MSTVVRQRDFVWSILLLLVCLLPCVQSQPAGADGGAVETPPAAGQGSGRAAVTAKTYANPVIPDATLADPTVIFVADTYYLYATGDTRGYDVYTSNDLIHWKKGPRVFKASRPQAWAPDVYRHAADGKFYLYYTTDQKIGVAVSDRPDGQFVDQGLLVEEAIDAHLFADDDGKLYLFYVKFPGFRVHVQCMATPLEMQGDPHPVLEPSQAWEKTHGHVTEGPWMLKHAGRCYLVYSGSGADGPDYAVGYAVSDCPTGPFEKYCGESDHFPELDGLRSWPRLRGQRARRQSLARLPSEEVRQYRLVAIRLPGPDVV